MAEDSIGTDIFEATLKDVPLLSAFSSILFYNSYQQDMPRQATLEFCAKEFHPDSLTKQIQRENEKIFIMALSETREWVGFAKVTLYETLPDYVGLDAKDHPGPYALVAKFYMKHSHHGLGLGKRLMAHILSYLKTESNCSLAFLTAWIHNHKAQRFYKKAGFIKTGCMEFQMGDAIIPDDVLTVFL